jgi:cytochrome c-type biogenesis protein CcmF
VLGWGGFWGWDAVEVAAFNPWLIGTAFLHSVMIQEKRGMFKQWNMILIILTYCAVIYGTFVTRSGLLSSVHSFAQSAIGPVFLAYVGLTFITSLALLISRWDKLKSENQMTSLLSREALFLLNNLIFLAIFVICFWGMNYSWISELITGQTATVGPPYYERAVTPLFATLLLLMGVAPLSAWGHSTVQTLVRAIWKPAIGALIVTVVLFATYTQNIGALIGFFLVALVILVTIYEYWRGAHARQHSQDENIFTAFWNLTGRNRRRYGGYIIHISMMLMAIGILGIEIFQVETQGTLEQGQSISLGKYELTYREIAQWDDMPKGVNYRRAVLDVYEDGEYLGQLAPRIDYYYESQQNMTIPGQRSTLNDDLYVLLIDWEPTTASGATFKLFVNPLLNWLWLGSFLFLAGIIIAAWPEKEAERVQVKARAPIPQKQTSAAD